MSNRHFVLVQGGAPPAAEPPSIEIPPDVSLKLAAWIFEGLEQQLPLISARVVVGRLSAIVELVNRLQNGVADSFARTAVSEADALERLEEHLVAQRDAFMRSVTRLGR